MAHKTFCSHKGEKTLARLVQVGDRYGREGCLTHPTYGARVEPLVEFFSYHPSDNKGDLDWYGVENYWFVSRYYLSTFMGKDEYSRNGGPVKNGVCLDGARPECDLDARDCQMVAAWIESRGGTSSEFEDLANTPPRQEGVEMKVNQAGEEAFDDVIWSAQDLTDNEAKALLLVLAEKLGYVVHRTNCTKHGDTQITLEAYEAFGVHTTPAEY